FVLQRDCAESEDGHGYINRLYRLSGDNVKRDNCAPYNDLIPCSYAVVSRVTTKLLSKFPQCGGLRGLNISAYVVPGTDVYIPCSYAVVSRVTTKLLSKFPQCGGLRGLNISACVVPGTDVYAPSVDISAYHNRVLRPKDFMVRCPMCIFSSQFARYVKFIYGVRRRAI
ncbi:hypothetical protein Tcan_10555, partial [Toxocara canis]